MEIINLVITENFLMKFLLNLIYDHKSEELYFGYLKSKFYGNE